VTRFMECDHEEEDALPKHDKYYIGS
jgi:hypothetical protein